MIILKVIFQNNSNSHALAAILFKKLFLSKDQTKCNQMKNKAKDNIKLRKR